MTTKSDSFDSLIQSVADGLALRATSLFDAAEAERVSPLFYYGFLRHGWPERVTEADRRKFRKAYYDSAGRNVELLSALSEVASALSKHDIACIAFKGADLAKRLYPNVALRPMGDVDVYVSPQDAERAEEVLTKLGFRPWSPDMTPGLSRRVRHARLYVGGRQFAMSIDLHWSLVGHSEDARAPEREWIDRHTRRCGEPWQCLSETAHLLYLTAHMKLQHYDEEIPLLWLLDFHWLATSGDIHWNELFDDGARFGWTDAIRACAFDARERLGSTLPPALERIAAPMTRALHRKGARNEPERVWNELRTLPWSGRLALARAYVLPSPSYVRFRYAPTRFVPAWAWPLGYLKRWTAMVFKAFALATRTLKRGDRTRPLLARRKTC